MSYSALRSNRASLDQIDYMEMPMGDQAQDWQLDPWLDPWPSLLSSAPYSYVHLKGIYSP